jgi:hypothetical protein
MKRVLVGLLSFFAFVSVAVASSISFDVQTALPPQLLYPGFTQIQMTTVSWNNGNGYSNATSQFTAPADGVYQLNASVSLDTGGQDCSAFILSLFLNGSELRRLSRTEWGHQFELSGSTAVKLNTNDVVDIRVFHNCSNPIVVEASGRAYFSGVLH